MGEEFKSLEKLYYKRKLKWYEKIYNFITGKKNEYQEFGKITELSANKED